MHEIIKFIDDNSGGFCFLILVAMILTAKLTYAFMYRPRACTRKHVDE